MEQAKQSVLFLFLHISYISVKDKNKCLTYMKENINLI